MPFFMLNLVYFLYLFLIEKNIYLFSNNIKFCFYILSENI